MDEELLSLSKKLRDEHMFVQSEKKVILELFKQVTSKSDELFTKQWINTRQHLIVEDLLCSRTKLTPAQLCYKYSNLTTKTQFIASHQLLSHNDYHVSEFLKALREKPEYLAFLIIKSEKNSSFNSTQLITGVDNSQYFSNQLLIPIVFQSLYANCVLVEDEVFCLQLLKHLIDLQFDDTSPLLTANNSSSSLVSLAVLDNLTNSVSNVDLRRLIRKKSCSFNILFKHYITFSFSAQLFLTTALHEPIINALTELSDDGYLDIDLEKALSRFTNEDLINRFGHPNSKDYKLKIQKYRERIIKQLYKLTMSFVDSINSSLFCFPTSLAWLIGQLYQTISRGTKATNQQDTARKLCIDLIMSLYICPAICDPEPFGIVSDIQISQVAHHNLIQIANILQVLAMSDDDKDPKTQDLYSKFRNNCMTEIFNSIISANLKLNKNNGLSESEHLQSLLLNPATSNRINNTSNTSLSETNGSQSILSRSTVMITLPDLHKLAIFMRQISKEAIESEETKWLKTILPNSYLTSALENIASSLNSSKNSSLNNRQVYTAESGEVYASFMKDQSADSPEPCQVMIVQINDKAFDCPGMLGEEKVLKEFEASSSVFKRDNFKRRQEDVKQKVKIIEDNDNLDSSYGASIKVTSFLASEIGIDRDEVRSRHDGSVEGISETNECRSISSSDDDNDGDDEDNEDGRVNNNVLSNANQLEDDGLSDFDTFSGRDTPIISGRDTPSSHSHEDLQNLSSNRNPSMNNLASSAQSRSDSTNVIINGVLVNSSSGTNLASRGPPLPVTVQKANREDINEKFCKFEISKTNAPIREEQLSEAWSLDADPPESVINEPIIDSLEDQSNNANNNNNNNATNNSNLINFNNRLNSSAANRPSSSTNLINFNSDAESVINNLTGSSCAAVSSTTAQTSNISAIGVISGQNSVDNDSNIDDRFSVASDTAGAWSTEQIINSDSDLDSYSPSKYTPYSTYSSNSSSQHTHPSIAEFTSLINNQHIYNKDNNLALNNNNNNNNNAAASNPNNQLDLLINKSSLNKTTENEQSSYQTPNIQSTKPGNTQLSNSQNTTNNKSRLSSIFSSTTSKLPLNLAVGGGSGVSQPKRGGFHRFFKTNSKQNSSSSDPFGFLNPFAHASISQEETTTTTTNNNSNNNNSQPTTTSTVSNSSSTTDANNIDNILKKYKALSSIVANQQQTQQQQQPVNSQPTANEGILIDLSSPQQAPPKPEAVVGSSLHKNPSSASLIQSDHSNLFYDSANLEQSKSFLDAKKKLRLVLSSIDSNSSLTFYQYYKSSKEKFLTMFLKTQLYDAISLQDKEKEVQLSEALRCISIYTESDCRKLLRSLKKDYYRRITYITYLTKSKQNLIYSINLIEKLVQRGELSSKKCTSHLGSVVARIFLEAKETRIQSFIADFKNSQTADEKFSLLKSFMSELKSKEFNLIWAGCPSDLSKLGNVCLERLIIGRVFKYAMYPNGEIDNYRDTKLAECFRELTVSPYEKLIGVSLVYENECPWTPAQLELKRLNVYKTPQDKLACVRKCILTIMNLLGIAKSPVCADDLNPVLIYVILKANPPAFLSNVQYIEGYFGKKLEFEDYYWAQFMFAFSYIKANLLNN